MRSIRSNLTYANVMASIAVFCVLGGGAFAASQIQKAPKNSVVSKSIRDGKVTSADLRDNNVAGADIATNAVTDSEIADNAVAGAEIADGAVASAEIADNAVAGTDIADGDVAGADLTDNGVTGTDVDEGSLGIVPNANNLDGFDADDFFRYGSVMPSGITIRGLWGGRVVGANNTMIGVYSFPLASGTALTDGDVNFADTGTSGTVGADDDASCNGTVNSPSAPAGKVCIYASDDNVLATADTARGYAAVSPRRGFQIRGPLHAVGDVEVQGAWAYTTP